MFAHRALEKWESPVCLMGGGDKSFTCGRLFPSTVRRLVGRLETNVFLGRLCIDRGRSAPDLEADHACRRVLPSQFPEFFHVFLGPGLAVIFRLLRHRLSLSFLD